MNTVYNLSYLEEISAGDKSFIAEMLHDFITNTPDTLIEVNTQIDASNYDEIYKIIHRFIPSFDYVGAEQIKEKLRIIEVHSRNKEQIDQIKILFNSVKAESIELINSIKNDFEIVV